MALNQNGRIAVFASLAEALRLTWRYRLPYLVIAYLMALPSLGAIWLGLFEPLLDIAALREIDGPAVLGEQMAQFHRVMIGLSIVGIAISVTFAVFWYRYLLLGREAALTLSLGRFNGVFWRSIGRGLVVVLILLILMFVLAISSVMLSGLILPPLGLAGLPIFLIMLLAAYILPFALAIRLSLVFPAMALEQRFSFSASWSTIRGSTWRVVGAVLLFVVPFMIAMQMINVGLFWLFFGRNLDVADPDPAVWSELVASINETFLIGGVVLAPVSALPMAISLALVAIAYRDLSGPQRSAELPAGASLA